jgi:hypothetical protein
MDGLAGRLGLAEVPLPGCAVPIPTVDGGTATLWAATLGRGVGGDAALGPRALEAWRDAVLSMPRGIGLLWSAVSRHRDEPPTLLKLAARPLGMTGVSPGTVDGPSVGLAFLLLLVSRVTGLAVPGDLTASAAVDASGLVSGVGGLAAKIAIVTREAPRVRRMLVSASQAGEAARAARAGLAIVGVRSVSEAARVVFGEALPRALVDLASTTRGRRDLVDSLFRLALQGRSELVDWTPVESAVALALDRFPDLAAEDRDTLRFVRAVAARHERNTGELPGDGWLLGQPLALRVDLAAHFAQQSADTGLPSCDDVERLIAPLLPVRLEEAHVPQLRLAGARARMLAVNGRPGEAMRLDEALVRAFTAAFAEEEASHPLAEWYRLSGACRDAQAFSRAEQAAEAIAARGGLEDGRAYLSLARAKSLVELGRVDDALPLLEAAARDVRLPEHLRLSAMRWAARPGRAVAREWREALRRDPGAEGPVGRVFVLLSDLDRALAEGTETAETLDALTASAPGIVGALRRAAPAGRDAAYVGRFYPY